MKVKTSEATPLQLNWLAAKCEGLNPSVITTPWDKQIRVTEWVPAPGGKGGRHTPLSYASCWSQGGPIIEREKINIAYSKGEWWASKAIGKPNDVSGPTPLIAAMRCFVASRLGDEVEIPEELR